MDVLQKYLNTKEETLDVFPQKSITSDAKNFPLENIAPPELSRTAPPIENIGREFQKLTAPDTSLLGRAGAAAMIGVNAFGIPQELATRAVTGGKYGLPSQIPGLAEKLPFSESANNLITDIALDPLNIVGGGKALVSMFRGHITSKPILASVLNHDEIVLATRKSLLFNSREEAVKLMRKANVKAPVVYDNKAKLWTYDFSELYDPNTVRQAIEDAKKKFKIREISPYDPAKGKRDFNIEERVTGKGREGAKHVTPWQMFLGTPSRMSSAAKTFVSVMQDANRAFDLMMRDVNEGIVKILAGSSMLTDPGNRNPLARAFSYSVYYAGNEKRIAAKFAADPKAAAAMKTFGEVDFGRRVNQILSLAAEQLPTMPNFKIPGMKGMTAGEWARKHPGKLPKEFFARLGGQFGDINPNNVNLKDILQFTFLKMAKEAHIHPTAQVLRRMIGRANDPASKVAYRRGEVAKLSSTEQKLLQNLLGGFLGQPDKIDSSVIQWILQNKDTVRAVLWGRDEYVKAAKAGKDLTDVGGLRGVLGRFAEDLIHKSKKRNPIVSQAAQAARTRIFSGLLGFALDSAVRNTTALLNTITNYGIGDTLAGMGSYIMSPQWREWLKHQDILGRTNAFVDDLLKKSPFESGLDKMDKIVMSPFTMSENFIRGSTYITALRRGINMADKTGKPFTLGQAMKYAEAQTARLMFSHNLLDMSPYMQNPVARTFLQFMNYPLKQTELMMEMYRTPEKGFRNQAVRYLTNLGAVIGYGRHLGVNVEDVFLEGLMPMNSLQEGFPHAPVLTAAAQMTNAGVNLVKRLFTGGGDPDMETPETAWKGIAEIAQYLVPGGRYTRKALKNIIEGGLLSEDYDARRTIANNPGLAPVFEGLGVNVDPGVDAYDRFVRLIGFKSTRDVKRKDLMNFLHQFIINTRNAKSEINETQAFNPASVPQVQARWRDHIRRTFGKRMELYNVPWSVIEEYLVPSNDKAVKRADERTGLPFEERIITSYPKAIKERIRLPEYGAPRPPPPTGRTVYP